jgi:hypothetical protein
MFAVVRTTRVENITPVSVFYVYTRDKAKADEICEMLNSWIQNPDPHYQRLVISAALTGLSFGAFDGFTQEDLAEVVEIKEFNSDLGANEYKRLIEHHKG